MANDIIIAPEPMKGIWHPDHWTSPYFRARFQVPPGLPRLRLFLFHSQSDALGENSVAIRCGTRLIAQVLGGPGETLYADRVIDLPPTMCPTPLDLSVRAAKVFRPDTPDGRQLGVVLKTFEIVMGQMTAEVGPQDRT